MVLEAGKLAFVLLAAIAAMGAPASAASETGLIDGRPDLAQRLILLTSTLRALQNDTAPRNIDKPPLFDLLQGSEASEARKVIVQAAIADARRLGRAVDITH
jgi:hypothetical protein